MAVEPMATARPVTMVASAQSPALPAMTVGEQVVADYRTTGLSLKHHPVALLRRRLDERGVLPAKDLARLNDGGPGHCGRESC